MDLKDIELEIQQIRIDSANRYMTRVIDSYGKLKKDDVDYVRAMLTGDEEWFEKNIGF